MIPDKLYEKELYTLNKSDKSQIFINEIQKIHDFHINNCEFYSKLCKSENISRNIENTNQLPFVAVRMFKNYELFSVPTKDIIKTLNSSGTTGDNVSKIFLDKETSQYQTKVLTKIVSTVLGKSRAPMLIIDEEGTIKNRRKFSARTAGILGFSIFGSEKLFCLNENMQLKYDETVEFISKHKGKRIFLFGFTFIIFLHFLEYLEKTGLELDLSNAVLIHGGGWKKLTDSGISSAEFKSRLFTKTRLSKIHDYYGMVEQTGSIYLECEKNYFHVSEFSDLIIRNLKTLDIQKKDNPGLIQTISLIPKSYPGHSILTEDIGVIRGEDDCECGRKGKYFEFMGRIPKAELRGCSNTYSQ